MRRVICGRPVSVFQVGAQLPVNQRARILVVYTPSNSINPPVAGKPATALSVVIMLS